MTQKITILDGGMSRELKRIGAPFKQPEWSALALMEDPDKVKQAHANYIEAGAEIITVNAYAVVPFHIGEEQFQTNGNALATLAGELAKKAASEAEKPVTVAGCIPPVFGSYRPDLFDKNKASEILKVLVNAQQDSCDVWLAETISSIEEARVIKHVLGDTSKPFWLSYTLQDEDASQSYIRSGESVEDAVHAALDMNVQSILFNCSKPEVMKTAIQKAKAIINKDIQIGVYANAFTDSKNDDSKANETVSKIRDDMTEEAYLKYSKEWADYGATIIGGCCGIGPEHIKVLSDHFTS